MAGVYIPGMDIPRCCEDCKLYNAEYDYCNYNNCTVGYEYSNKRMDDCPLVEVPDHGDLIDRDLLLNNVDADVLEDRCDYAIFGYSTKQILTQPAVISANKEEVKE